MDAMSHTQKSLTAFQQKDGNRDKDESPTLNSSSGSEECKSDITTSEFGKPTKIPEAQIQAVTDGEITANLCLPGDTVSPTFATVAGRGGMGNTKKIKNPSEILEIVELCQDLPVMITGGGMNSPMGGGAIFGKLLSGRRVKETIQVKTEEIYREHGPSRSETRFRRLGSYQLSIPKTKTDCRKAIQAFSAWENNEIEYLNPVKRQKKEIVNERIETFEKLSPADKINTPEYATTLEVVSDPYETYAVIPRGTLSNRTIKVLSVVVSNPRGGYYQLGIDKTTVSQPGNEIPMCYMSGSSSTPPTPNTAFTRDTKFSSTDVEIVPIKHPPDPKVVPPNEEVLNSPLPEPRMQTPLQELDGIGEKTARKVRQKCDERVSAESLAYTMFENGDIHRESLRGVKSILESLPQTDSIYEQLKNHTPEP